ncbi:transcription factor TFIIA complex subunit Toa1 [Penicillium riverlandense]|uniref:transcription factor TFIIA complex subunit Toa1 n=1 Tax=Penicillium riverlandense TaxID=1903569 RepID=UPI0025485088|nr:transcription factor TFIIA complex subunit Toa1 [Penicillium riverlandense]KAJ5819330.1 transcription factor TFIIA complex subunit Toa1 [Penicillium riverlandense]
MSNTQVGPVFERVIQEVCDASQVDFEESGVDQQTLHDLKETWQKKLSSVNVAHFPWDPPPPQPAPPQSQNSVLPATATVPSNAPRPNPPQVQQHVPASLPPVSAPAAAANMAQMPRIKTEPGSNGQVGLPPHMNNPMPAHTLNPQSARDRAVHQIQQKYGAAAATSVNQMQNHHPGPMGMPGQMHPHAQYAANGQMPAIKTEPGYPATTQPNMGQTDGADDALADWKAEVARRREAAAAQNGQGDRLLRTQVKTRMLEMEAGGLLRPLDEHEADSSSRAARRALAANMPAEASVTPSIPGQFDGADGEVKEEADEDAINSDLDDPDDLVAGEQDDDEPDGQVMLCTYDKVQRVKNKWKCTLKDGILTSGGKEYVFHKGQGEFEW